MHTPETLIVHLKTSEEYRALKAFLEALEISFETTDEKAYAPEFVNKIQKSKEEFEKGDFISLEKDDLKNFLGL